MILEFLYCNARGERSVRALTHWNENDKYIQGRTADDPQIKTYLKCRVIEILSGHDLVLGDAAPVLPRPAARKPLDERPAVLFTGFAKAEREALEAEAEQGGMRVVQSQIKGLTFLCCGSRAGPVKITKAHEAGSFILDVDTLRKILETGELSGE